MGLITPAHAIVATDKYSVMFNALYGTSASGLGVGDSSWGYSLKVADWLDIVQGGTNAIWRDANLQNILAGPALSLNTNANIATFFQMFAGPGVQSLDACASQCYVVSSSIIDFDSFLAWYNYGNGVTYWQCLACPDWFYAWSAYKHGKAPSIYACYYVIIQGASYRGTTFTNAMSKFVVSGAGTGVRTAGSNVPSTHAGGYAYLVWSGASGTGTVTVTGTDQDGNVETWTATLSGTSGSIILNPGTHAWSLIRSVTNITIVAGITAGTLYVEAHAPAGRTNPPT